MANNLLEKLKEHLSGNVVSNIASFLGESPQITESAINTTLSSVLACLVEQSENTQSAGNLLNLIAEGSHDGGVLSNLGALSLGGEETSKLSSQGTTILSTLLGDKLGGLTDLLAKSSGVSKNSSSSLLGFVTPIVLGLIGKTLKIDQLDNLDGLTGLLSGQKPFLQNYIPDGLTNLLSGGSSLESAIDKTETTADSTISEEVPGSDSFVDHLKEQVILLDEALDNVSETMEEVAEEALAKAKHLTEGLGETVSQMGETVVNESKEFAHSAVDVIEEGAGEGGKFLPWILIAAAIALLWGLLKSCSVPEPTTDTTATAPTTTTPEPPVPATAPVTTAPPTPEPVVQVPPTEPPKTEAPSPTTEPSSDSYEKSLPGGYAIKAAKDGLVSKLIGFIESNEAINKDLWFTMDGIQFDTNKAHLRADSDTQISHIAEILKAYPKVKIKIGGYTDNTGTASANQKLSNNRAIAVKKAIIGKGVLADRMDAEGYGSDHPVASNDTPEGRQQNRRIDVRVTEK